MDGFAFDTWRNDVTTIANDFPAGGDQPTGVKLASSPWP